VTDEPTNPGRSPVPQPASLTPGEAASIVLAELEPMRKSLHELRGSQQTILLRLEVVRTEQGRLNGRADEILDLAHSLLQTLTKQADSYVGLGAFSDLRDEVRDLAARIEALERGRPL
jgi:hypothetical protein